MINPRVLLLMPELYLPFFRGVLERAYKADITVASDGKSALNRIRENTYDLYIINYLLPQYNGLELVDAIEKGQHSPRVIVLISQVYTSSLVTNAHAAGVTKFYKTPFAMTELIEYLDGRL